MPLREPKRSPGTQLDPPCSGMGFPVDGRGSGGPQPVVEAHGAGAGVGVTSFLSNSSLVCLRGPINGHFQGIPGPVLPSCAHPLFTASQDSQETAPVPVPWHTGVALRSDFQVVQGGHTQALPPSLLV